MLSFNKLVRSIEQSLGGYAAPVQTGAAQYGLIILIQHHVDAGRIHAQLGSPNGGVITRRSTADNNYVVGITHLKFQQYSRWVFQHAFDRHQKLYRFAAIDQSVIVR